MKNVILITGLLLLIGAPAHAYEEPLKADCRVSAEVLSIASGEYYWNDTEYYHYYDVGILIREITPRPDSSKLAECSPLTGPSRTAIVRIWDWNNTGTVWTYKNKTTMQPHDKVQLNLTQTFVGEGSWPTVIAADPE
ncbi:MAG: hypothetical protein KC900_01625 [Candidatus Omnitrophica bacterium]|nr:hypothetical protein [Candidatus Omnitrophota bacterium]